MSPRQAIPSRIWRCRPALLASVALACAASALTTAPIASASSVTNPTVTADSYVAGNTAAVWTVGLTPTTTLGFFDSITVTFPAGFDVSHAQWESIGSEFDCGVTVPTTQVSGQSVQINLLPSCALGSGTPGSVSIVGISPVVSTYMNTAFTVATSTDVDAVSPASGVTIIPDSVAGAPTGVSASVTSGASATVTFTAGADAGTPVSDFLVTATDALHSGDTVTDFDCQDYLSPCVVTGLTAGETYTFTVKAVNGAGNSTASSPSSPLLVDVAAGAPTGVSATASDSVAHVAFTPGANAGSAVTDYLVSGVDATNAAHNVTSFDCASTSSPCAVTGLHNGEHYTFTVVAVNGAGDSAASSASNSVIPDAVAGAPTGVAGSVTGATSATVSFSAGADTGSAVSDFLVTATDALHAGHTVTGFDCASTSSPCLVTGLTVGETYTFTVVAVNGAGNSAASMPSSGLLIDVVAGAPTGVAATASDTVAHVSFTPGANFGSAVTDYVVSGVDATNAGHDLSDFDCASTTSPCTITGLHNAESYTFTVKAVNGAGNSAASSASNSVTPASAPDAPTAPTATVGPLSSTVSWTDPVSDGGVAITGYTVTASGGGSHTCTATGPTATQCTVTGLTAGTAYTFTVTATNQDSETGAASTASNSVTPTEVATTTSLAPSASTATAGSSVTFTAHVSANSPGVGSPDGTVSFWDGATKLASCSNVTVSSGAAGCTAGFTTSGAHSITATYSGSANFGASTSSATTVTVSGGVTIPAAPTNVKVQQGKNNTTAIVDWTAVAATGGPVTYTVAAADGKVLGTTTGTQLVVTFPSSQVGKTVVFEVAAASSAGSSPEAASVSLLFIDTSVIASPPQSAPAGTTTRAITVPASAGSASSASVTAEVSGGGSVTTQAYSQSPVSGASLGLGTSGVIGNFFDVKVVAAANGKLPALARVSVCGRGLSQTQRLFWYNASARAYQPVTDLTTFVAGKVPCWQLTIVNPSALRPTMKEMTGTVFALVRLPSISLASAAPKFGAKTVTLTATCSVVKRCVGVVTMTRRVRRHTVVVAMGEVTIAKGRARTITLKLTKAGKALHGTVRLSASAKVKGAAPATTHTYRVKVR